MPAQGIFGSPPNRRRFWRRPVLAKLGLSDEAARSTAAKAAQEPRQGSDQGIDVRYTIRVDRVALARRATGTIRDLQGPLARKPNRARCGDVRATPPRPDTVVPLCLSRWHVRFLRHDRER